jgi:hypothetical protein
MRIRNSYAIGGRGFFLPQRLQPSVADETMRQCARQITFTR